MSFYIGFEEAIDLSTSKTTRGKRNVDTRLGEEIEGGREAERMADAMKCKDVIKITSIWGHGVIDIVTAGSHCYVVVSSHYQFVEFCSISLHPGCRGTCRIIVAMISS